MLAASETAVADNLFVHSAIAALAHIRLRKALVGIARRRGSLASALGDSNLRFTFSTPFLPLCPCPPFYPSCPRLFRTRFSCTYRCLLDKLILRRASPSWQPFSLQSPDHYRCYCCACTFRISELSNPRFIHSLVMRLQNYDNI